MTKTQIQRLQNECMEFQKNFPGQTIEGIIQHMIDELEELKKHPRDIMEQADLLIFVLVIAGKQKLPADILVEATFLKMKINRTRKWPKKPDRRGVFHHVV